MPDIALTIQQIVVLDSARRRAINKFGGGGGSGVAVFDQLLQLLARSIFEKAHALNSLELTSNQRKRLRASITFEIRTAGLLLYPEVLTPEVSEAARREAERIGVDLYTHTWRSQSSFDRGRKVFHWEHVDPISCIQKACVRAGDAEAVRSLLQARLRIAWILKREDRFLTQLGFRSNRPDPEAAYRAAKIVLVKRASPDAEPGAAPDRRGM
jgi:hypothetical protein